MSEQNKVFVVQTSPKVIQRCLLMTTEPCDLVLDPTCGSGTTAYVSEQWGRRWITIDTSRVSVSLARQRLLTAKFEYYELNDKEKGISGDFKYKVASHISLEAITQNQALDPVLSRWQPLLEQALQALNQSLGLVTPELRTTLARKLAEKEKREGKSAVSEADRRRWLLPAPGESWQEWQVPYDADEDYPQELRTALEDYRRTWRGKMDEVNATIAASAPSETLVDQPEVVSGILRVSGPFTVEGVQPAEASLDAPSPIEQPEGDLPTFSEPLNAAAYQEQMLSLLRAGGVRFPDNRQMDFIRLEPSTYGMLSAEGEWGDPASPRKVAVSLGPQYGPITARQVEQALRAAYRRGVDDLVFAGFAFDGAAQAAIQADENPDVRCHLAHISPDVHMGDLLKTTTSSQLFTVFGLPRVELTRLPDGEFEVEMQGVDIYNPLDNTVNPTSADRVAAWFLDSDYDGRTFCITQAFFPDTKAWDKLAVALKSSVDPERFAAFSGTRSLPFKAGIHQRAAVKAIDPRGNEVLRILNLAGEGTTYA